MPSKGIDYDVADLGSFASNILPTVENNLDHEVVLELVPVRRDPDHEDDLDSIDSLVNMRMEKYAYLDYSTVDRMHLGVDDTLNTIGSFENLKTS